jgi:hypothetical protein
MSNEELGMCWRVGGGGGTKCPGERAEERAEERGKV